MLLRLYTVPFSIYTKLPFRQTRLLADTVFSPAELATSAWRLEADTVHVINGQEEALTLPLQRACPGYASVLRSGRVQPRTVTPALADCLLTEYLQHLPVEE